MNEIAKLKYHINLLAEAIDVRANPIASMVISNDWSSTDLDAAHDIFEHFDKKLENGEKINWHEFEAEFKRCFGIHYQGLKSVVLAFFRNEQWTSVCREYAASVPSVEFSEILGTGVHSLLEERVASILIKHNVKYSREFRLEALNGERMFILDFLLQLPKGKVAIEVKHVFTTAINEQIEALSKRVINAAIADHFWLVVEHASAEDRRAFTATSHAKLMTLDDFEFELRNYS